MAKIALAAACLILMFSNFTNAAPLEIQSGWLNTNAFFGFSIYSFGGPGFSVMGGNGSLAYTGGNIGWLFTRADLTVPPQTQVVVNGFPPCIPVFRESFFSQSTCGQITVTLDAQFMFPPNFDPQTYLATQTFTAVGHLNVGDTCNPNIFPPPPCTGFDIVGRGVATLRFVDIGTPGGGNPFFGPQGSLTFGATQAPLLVPEASSLGQLSIGILAFALLRRHLC
jgi:hypothetical protein